MSTPAPTPTYGLCPQCGFNAPIEQFYPPPPEEFPKMLYKGTPDNYSVLVVNNPDEEAAATADGYTDAFPVAKKDDSKKEPADKAKPPEQHSGGHALFGGRHQEEPAKKK